MRTVPRRWAPVLFGVVALWLGAGCTSTPQNPSPAAAQPTAKPTAQPTAAADQASRQATMTRMQGVWKGMFRRYDAAGVLNQTLASEVQIRFPKDSPLHDYHQTNLLTLPDGSVQRIESFGKWEGRVLRFSNTRIDGWFTEVEADPTGLISVLFIAFKDGSGLTMSEIISLAPDGSSRLRAAQYSVGGKLLRRTLIDEVRESR
jgi:hypothetical protein